MIVVDASDLKYAFSAVSPAMGKRTIFPPHIQFDLVGGMLAVKASDQLQTIIARIPSSGDRMDLEGKSYGFDAIDSAVRSWEVRWALFFGAMLGMVFAYSLATMNSIIDEGER